MWARGDPRWVPVLHLVTAPRPCRSILVGWGAGGVSQGVRVHGKASRWIGVQGEHPSGSGCRGSICTPAGGVNKAGVQA